MTLRRLIWLAQDRCPVWAATSVCVLCMAGFWAFAGWVVFYGATR